MVVSIYICEIPRNTLKKDIESLFRDYNGYIETRMKATNDNRKIAFVDYEDEEDAKFVIDTLQGFRFSPEDKGLILKISDNSKNGRLQKDKEHLLGSKRDREQHRSSESSYRQGGKSSYDNKPSYKKEEENKNASSTATGANQGNNNILDLLGLLAGMSGQPQQQNTQVPPQIIPKNTYNNNPYTINEQQQNQNVNPANEGNVNIVDLLQNIQTFQLLSNLAGGGNTTAQAPQQQQVHEKHTPRNNFHSTFNHFDEQFKSHMDIKKNATNIVYVEGLPLDSTEREVSHVFRPFPGFKSVRLITRDKKGEKSVLCFADFEDITQSTICINTLQGYRFDKNDLVGLHFSYGISKYKR
jgi:RNA recognition motif-containing protein